jgi:hypothetical protein
LLQIEIEAPRLGMKPRDYLAKLKRDADTTNEPSARVLECFRALGS